MKTYAYCKNNSLAHTEPSGLFAFSPRYLGTEGYASWQEVRDYAEEQKDLAVDGVISDVEALARISDKVAEWSKRYPGKFSETLMYVAGLSELLCRQVMGLTGPEPNPNQIGGFNDSNGFHDVEDSGFINSYEEKGSNQVDHFVAYIQASYYAGVAPATLWLWDQEGTTNSPDWHLGMQGIFVGGQLLLYVGLPWPLSSVGLRPDEVGWYIRQYLADRSWTPYAPDDPNDPNDPNYP